MKDAILAYPTPWLGEKMNKKPVDASTAPRYIKYIPYWA